jgi:lysophospholipase L1-like esterase
MIGALGLVAAIALLLFGVVYVQGVRRPVGTPDYVALGSSYASGPGLPPRAAGSPFLCGRSDANYAHLLARKRGLALVDATCAGATTEHVLHGGQYFQSAQLDAVTAQTRLATITIGGNDIFYLGNLTALSCGPNPSTLESITGLCRQTGEPAVAQGFARLARNLRTISSEVHRKAPRARLVFVTYFTVLPDSGSCARVPLSGTDAARMRAVATRLAAMTRQAAAASGAEVVDIAALSRGHDICAADPWLNGRHPPALLMAPLHPNAEGMQAVADAIDRALG